MCQWPRYIYSRGDILEVVSVAEAERCGASNIFIAVVVLVVYMVEESWFNGYSGKLYMDIEEV